MQNVQSFSNGSMTKRITDVNWDIKKNMINIKTFKAIHLKNEIVR